MNFQIIKVRLQKQIEVHFCENKTKKTSLYRKS